MEWATGLLTRYLTHKPRSRHVNVLQLSAQVAGTPRGSHSQDYCSQLLCALASSAARGIPSSSTHRRLSGNFPRPTCVFLARERTLAKIQVKETLLFLCLKLKGSLPLKERKTNKSYPWWICFLFPKERSYLERESLTFPIHTYSQSWKFYTCNGQEEQWIAKRIEYIWAHLYPLAFFSCYIKAILGM